MAIIKLGATVVGIRGTAGGLTFSVNGSGPFVKAWGGARHKRTLKQSTQRSNIGDLAQRWRALTGAQRTAWNALTAAPPEVVTNSLGEVIALSGYQWFCKVVGRRQLVTATPSYLAPTTAAPTYNQFTTLTLRASGSLNVAFDIGSWPANHYLITLWGIFPSVGRLVASANWKLLWAAAPTNDGWSYVTTPYYAAFGAPIVGQVGFARCSAQSVDGLRSVEQVIRKVTTAT